MDANGVLLDYRWVVGTDGKLRLSLSSCVAVTRASCPLIAFLRTL
jgi:hypothetical protein